MTETFYDVLGIPEDASQEEITAAYREKVKEYHPDVSDRDDAAERFKEVTRAEEVLGDEDERARYDRLGHEAYVRHLEGADAGDGSGVGTGASADQASGTRSTRERARDVAGDGTDDGPSHHHRQRRRRQQKRRQQRRKQRASRAGAATGRRRANAAGAATASSSGAAAAGGAGATETATPNGSSTNDADGGSAFSVHDWEPAEKTFLGGRPALTQEALTQTIVIAVLYPALLYSSVTPEFSPLVNVVVGVSTLLLVGYLITLPLVAIAVFGVWSVLVPLVMTSAGFAPLSLPVVVATLACWIPLAYSVTVAFVLRW